MCFFVLMTVVLIYFRYPELFRYISACTDSKEENYYEDDVFGEDERLVHKSIFVPFHSTFGGVQFNLRCDNA